MLVLTRRVGESIIINNDIEIVVIGVRGHQVKIGINAPEKINVHRKEIHERIQQEKEDAEDAHS